MDVDIWQGIEEVMSIVDHNRRPKASNGDNFGNVHVVLFGDYKHSADKMHKYVHMIHISATSLSCVVLRACRCVEPHQNINAV